MKKRKSEIVFKCDYCGSITSYFVTTAEYNHFCLEQVPGYPASKDCMTPKPPYVMKFLYCATQLGIIEYSILIKYF